MFVKATDPLAACAIASQHQMLFERNSTSEIFSLATEGKAFVNPALLDSWPKTLSPCDFHLTNEGFKVLFDQGTVRFKNSGFEALVKQGVAHVLPVIELFTSDNLKYNPPLVLNEKDYVLEDRVMSYSFDVIGNTFGVVRQVAFLKTILFDKSVSPNVFDRFEPQKIPLRLVQQMHGQ